MKTRILKLFEHSNGKEKSSALANEELKMTDDAIYGMISEIEKELHQKYNPRDCILKKRDWNSDRKKLMIKRTEEIVKRIGEISHVYIDDEIIPATPIFQIRANTRSMSGNHSVQIVFKNGVLIDDGAHRCEDILLKYGRYLTQKTRSYLNEETSDQGCRFISLSSK